jgi:VIT1/CCC1 family predicted Fe2+/Mn2+ transporter
MAQPDMGLRAHTQEELGVDIDRLPSPWVASGSSFVAFCFGAFVPLAPYVANIRYLWLALLLGAVGLFASGAFSSRFTYRTPLYAGSRQLILGAVAAALTYTVGQAVGTGVG